MVTKPREGDVTLTRNSKLVDKFVRYRVRLSHHRQPPSGNHHDNGVVYIQHLLRNGPQPQLRWQNDKLPILELQLRQFNEQTRVLLC